MHNEVLFSVCMYYKYRFLFSCIDIQIFIYLYKYKCIYRIILLVQVYIKEMGVGNVCYCVTVCYCVHYVNSQPLL